MPPDGVLIYKASAAAAGRRCRRSQPSSTHIQGHSGPSPTPRLAGRPRDALLIRHAESVWNEHFGATRIDIGLPDPPLTARGVEQARRAAERLRYEPVRRLITSPYRRTLQTASILAAELRLPIAIDVTVRERCAFSCDQGSAPAGPRPRVAGLDFAGLDEVWWGGVIESWPSLAARCAAFRARSAAPDRDEVAVVKSLGLHPRPDGCRAAQHRFDPARPRRGVLDI